ncbi:MAG: hypothetical protein J7L15_01320 [Clostridiales bacterium]|nr:hypothetical protein [Clostridiales bacterium]
MGLYGNPDKAQNSAIANGKIEEESTAAVVTVLSLSKMDYDGVNAVLPTSDPAVAGALWNNSNVVNVSVG